MFRLRLVRISILLVFLGFSHAAPLSDCLLKNRIKTVNYAGQTNQFESQYIYAS